MSLGQGMRGFNVIRTINARVKASFENGYAGIYSGRVLYEDPLADPTALDSRNTNLNYFSELTFISHAPGLNEPLILQVDHFYEVGDAADSNGDRYGHKVAKVADDFREAFGAGGVRNTRGFFVYDYSVTPSSPTVTEDWLLIRNARGAQGMPEDERRLAVEAGYQRIAQTWHIWTAIDLADPPLYF